ncbi:MAG: hypothetical protein M3015_14985 [Bacteroidota bacterium]|nr:hypothetical protein [Bacteroidota bacterium]
MLTQSIYNEVAEFMAAMNPSKVVAFKPSAVNQTRFDLLLGKNGNGDLSNDEKTELEHYLILNRIIGLAKARALDILGK